MTWLFLALCLRAPVPGPMVSPYGPEGRYAGHHGADFSAPAGTPVFAAGSGTITFAGSVAGMLTITIDHGDLRSSVSYLSEVGAKAGARVEIGAVIGHSGIAHGRAAVHFSIRIGDTYTDPMPFLLCRVGGEERLYLLPPPPRSYARFRVKRTDGRYFRSTPHRPPVGWRGRLSPARSRAGPLRPGRFTLAKGGQLDQSGGDEVGDDQTGHPGSRILPPR